MIIGYSPTEHRYIAILQERDAANSDLAAAFSGWKLEDVLPTGELKLSKPCNKLWEEVEISPLPVSSLGEVVLRIPFGRITIEELKRLKSCIVDGDAKEVIIKLR